ncbi:MAG TPA: hypothetical protein VHW09_17570 [Bryobacteraceae bacterium]|jgi:hypothetical protein|nr:hypothetical protein [Bryobacteraceae bacterium]
MMLHESVHRLQSKQSASSQLRSGLARPDKTKGFPALGKLGSVSEHEARTMNFNAVAINSHACVKLVDLTRSPALSRLAFLIDQLGACTTECRQPLKQEVIELSWGIDEREHRPHECTSVSSHCSAWSWIMAFNQLTSEYSFP